MIIEVTGGSGVGKSTYINSLIDHLNNNGVSTGAIHSVDMNYCELIPDYFCDLSKQNIRTDLADLPWCCLLLAVNPRFLIYAILGILKIDGSVFEKVAMSRSFIRKAGIFRYLKQKKFSAITILVDEGLFHSAHNFLCSPKSHASTEKVTSFFNLCPLPDKLIILLASKEIRLRRLVERGDLSPRIKGKRDLVAFVGHSQKLYDFFSSLCVSAQFGCVINMDMSDKFSEIRVGAEYIDRS